MGFLDFWKFCTFFYFFGFLDVFFNVSRQGRAGKPLASSQQPPGATSSHQHLVDIKLGLRDWADRFGAVVCGDDQALNNGKPAPDIFLLCAERLQVDPTQCIAFEDSPNGVKAALAAGMQVVAIESPYVEKEALDGASAYIQDYDELSEFVGQLG